MEIHRLKILLQQIHLRGDVICFDQLYNYKKKFIIEYAFSIYKYVSNKTVYSVSDIIQETWLNTWLFMNNDYINIKSEPELDSFLRGVANDVIIEINKK